MAKQNDQRPAKQDAPAAADGPDRVQALATHLYGSIVAQRYHHGIGPTGLAEIAIDYATAFWSVWDQRQNQA